MEYVNIDYENPKYIYHGSVKLIDGNINPNQAQCMSDNKDNTYNAIYGTPLFDGAIPYAFPKQDERYFDQESKTFCEGYEWSCNQENGKIKAIVNLGTINEDAYGYVYIFDASNFERVSGSSQYISINDQKPIDIIKVYFKDYKNLFIFENNPKLEYKKH